MRASPARLWVFGVLLLLSGSGCAVDEVRTRGGELALVARDAQGRELLQPAHTYALGLVFEGQSRTQVVEVRNLGDAELTLASVEPLEGDAVDVGQPPAAGAPFALAFAPGLRIPAGGTVPLEVSFRAPVGAGRQDYRTRVRLKADNARAGKESVELTLEASTASGQCALPEQLRVRAAVGDEGTLGFTLTNPLPVAALATVGALAGESADVGAFRPAHGTPVGSIELAPGEAVEVAYVFQPLEARTYHAFVPLRRAEHCPEVRVALVGEALETLLTWSPQVLDFGAVLPGRTVEQQVTFHNAGLTPLSLSSLRLAPGGGPFGWAGPAAQTLEVPPEGALSVTLRFAPPSLGALEGTLTFATSLASQAQGVVRLKGLGGGPDARVRPEEVNFGRVAYFPDAPAAGEQRRRLLVSNQGTLQPKGDARLRLHLGTRDASGAWGAPFFAITPADASTQAEEFSLVLPEGFDAAEGISPEVGHNQLVLEVVVRPRSLGRKEAWLTLYTDDPDAPEQRVHLVAQVETLPPCRYRLSPARLDFGLMAAPDTRVLGFVLTNLGTQPGEECLVSSVALTPDSRPTFAIDETGPEARVLAPGETLRLEVEARPPPASGLQPLTGELTFAVSSPEAPQGRVPLKVTAGSSCLLLAPDTLRFGVLARDCQSQSRSAVLYNVCSEPVVVDSLQLVSAAGVPAGSPGCASALDCPEFYLQAPALPVGGLTLAPGAKLAFSATYRPKDVGADVGLVAVGARRGGVVTSQVLALEGRGDATGSNTDLFQGGEGVRMADILFSIDSSGSMGNDQDRLAQNLDAFMEALFYADVDFHIAVVKGQLPTSNPTPGEFVVGPGHPERFLTRSSPDLLSQFRAKVKVGASGADEHCFRPALEALSAPLSLGTNAGFLRQDATLSVICISDDVDHSPEPVSFFRDAFFQLKRNPNLFSTSAIAVFTQGTCGNPDDGRYSEMVDTTGGYRTDLCGADWGNTLAQIGRTAGGSRHTFFLTSAPAGGQAGVEVRLEGDVVPQATPGGAPIWTYDGAQNAIVFSPGWLPQPGEALAIHYTAACY